jgi:hypothetical protein
MKKITLTFAFIVFGLSLIRAQSDIKTDHYNSMGFDCVIFPSSYPTELDGTPFTPAHSDLDTATRSLTAKLKTIKCDNKDDRSAITDNLPKYKIQVFGYTDKAGNKTLFLNCFRNDREKDKDLSNTWLTDMVQVQGGGNYFWTVKYDLSKGVFYDFKTNGN